MLVVTTCSSRKTVSPARELTARDLPAGQIDAVAGEWLSRLARAEPTIAAGKLYAGRGFTHACSASTRAPFVISAGLGLLPPDRPVPSYGLTVASAGEDDVFSRIQGRRDPRAWWAHLARSPFSISVEQLFRDDEPVLIALSAPYLAMIGEDLAALPERQLNRVRLFVPGRTDGIAERLHPCVMPYDGARLGELGGVFRGPVIDLAQRALRHFATVVLPTEPHGDVEDHARAVERLLAAGVDREPPTSPSLGGKW